MLVIVLVVAACGGTTADGSDVETTTTTTAAAQPTTTASAPEPSTTAPDEVTEGVAVVDSEFGEILVDPDGFTLYIFTQDAGGESACYDACATLWPPVDASTSINSDLDAAMFGSTARTDGSEQLTVNGMPLYLYTPDANPGDITGQGFSGVWFVVGPDGNMIEAAAGGNTVIDYGY